MHRRTRRAFEIEQLLERQAEKFHQLLAIHSENLRLRRMDANQAFRRDIHRGGDLERDRDALVHPPLLHDVIALGPHMQMRQRRSLVAEHELVEQRREIGARSCRLRRCRA